ncbi:hypothetical protein [Nostoc sp. ChiQUE01b]|uniref:hypothetical protein n=1 Tax=Nostoc sp. ChiQUE01b TaxID=3075376 RepID=UPI002AD299AB|nr:hypothetical protein [Nostoc sp. ChiQUE01b]MDZ8260755.1 hypothetical protein [Nostoc sp. ChiQUE01b]
MFATTTPKSAPVVWQGETRDGYTLRLTRSGLAKIASNLQQTGLHHLVQNNLNGSREAAVVRAIAQVVTNATRSSANQNTQVFTAIGKTRKYKIVTQPIDRQQSAIMFVRSLPIQEFEYEYEDEYEYENEYEDEHFLGSLGRAVSAARKIAPAAKKAASAVRKAAPAARKAASTLRRAAPAARKAASTLRRAAPAAKKAASTVRKAAPAVRKAASTLRRAAPAARRAASTVRKAAPAVRRAASTVRKASPAVRKAASTLRRAAPAARRAALAARRAAPAARRAASTLRKAAPAARRAALAARRAAPAARRAASTLRRAAPALRRAALKLGRARPIGMPPRPRPIGMAPRPTAPAPSVQRPQQLKQRLSSSLSRLHDRSTKSEVRTRGSIPSKVAQQSQPSLPRTKFHQQCTPEDRDLCAFYALRHFHPEFSKRKNFIKQGTKFYQGLGLGINEEDAKNMVLDGGNPPQLVNQLLRNVRGIQQLNQEQILNSNNIKRVILPLSNKPHFITILKDRDGRWWNYDSLLSQPQQIHDLQRFLQDNPVHDNNYFAR